MLFILKKLARIKIDALNKNISVYIFNKIKKENGILLYIYLEK